MFLKSLVRKAIGKLVEPFGYRLRYARPLPSDRVVYRAYLNGYCFHCYKDTVIAESILTGKGWDPRMRSLLRDAVERNGGRDVIEVGANIGASILPVAPSMPEISFHLIEPIPAFYDLLERNRESCGAENVDLLNVAVSDRDRSSLNIECGIGNAGVRIIDGLPVDSCEVETRTLDSLFSGKRIAFIKIDVDGYELGVLRGGVSILRESAPDVFMEFYPELMRRIGVRPGDVLDVLTSSGLLVYDVYGWKGDLLAAGVSAERVMEIAAGTLPYVDIVAKPDGTNE